MPDLNGDLLALIGVIFSTLVALYLGVRKSGSENRTVAATEVEKLGERLDEQRDQGREDAETIRAQNQTILDLQTAKAAADSRASRLEEQLLQRATELATATTDLSTAAEDLARAVRSENAARRGWRVWEEHAYLVRRAAQQAGATELPEVPVDSWEEAP